jgi:hypothetical protein
MTSPKKLIEVRGVIHSRIMDDLLSRLRATRGNIPHAYFDRLVMPCYIYSDSTRHASIERCAHPCGSFYFYTP